MNMGYEKMRDLACYIAISIWDWDKDDIEAMVEQIRCKETVVDFLRAYEDRFGIDMKDKIEWALLAEV